MEAEAWNNECATQVCSSEGALVLSFDGALIVTYILVNPSSVVRCCVLAAGVFNITRLVALKRTRRSTIFFNYCCLCRT